MSVAPLHKEIDRLESLVRRQLSGRVREFCLVVQADGLILQGRALTYHAKQLAQHVVMQATRMPIVANEIGVGIVAAPQDELASV